MKKAFQFVCVLAMYFNFVHAKSSEGALISTDYIRNFLTHEAAWADSHNGRGDYLGTGMFYYALAYMKKAKLCICLGSGGGFVPRIMNRLREI